MKYAVLAIDRGHFKEICNIAKINPIDARFIQLDDTERLVKLGYYAEQVYPEWKRDVLVEEGIIRYKPKGEEDGN